MNIFFIFYSLNLFFRIGFYNFFKTVFATLVAIYFDPIKKKSQINDISNVKNSSLGKR